MDAGERRCVEYTVDPDEEQGPDGTAGTGELIRHWPEPDAQGWQGLAWAYSFAGSVVQLYAPRPWSEEPRPFPALTSCGLGARMVTLETPDLAVFATGEAWFYSARACEAAADRAEPDLLGRLIRAVWRAGRWLAEPGSPTLAAELLSRKEYLDLPAEILDRALNGRLVISAQGEERHVPGFVEFHHAAATFPWRSQAEWIGMQLAARTGLDRPTAARAARAVFRSDLYREALAPTRAALPGASSKIEGALSEEMAVASTAGRLFLGPDSFFDGRIFEPSAR